MKLVPLALALLPLCSAAATIGEGKIVRMTDGHAVNCTQLYEGGRTAYVPELKALAIDEGGHVNLELSVTFQLCVRNGKELYWATRRPLDPLYGLDSDGGEIRTEFRDPELVLSNEMDTAWQVAALENRSTDQVGYRFLPKEFLTQEQLADLAAGKPVRVRTSLVYRAIGTAYSSRGETRLGYQFGGTYTLFFTLQK